jgi:hypothetical protein
MEACFAWKSTLFSALRQIMREKKDASPGADSRRHTPIDTRKTGRFIASEER